MQYAFKQNLQLYISDISIILALHYLWCLWEANFIFYFIPTVGESKIVSNTDQFLSMLELGEYIFVYRGWGQIHLCIMKVRWACKL